MKKFFLLFSFAVLTATAVQAQASFGIRGGASFFTLGGDDVSEDNYSNRVGFHAGAYATLLPEGPISVEPGIFYSVKGSQNDDGIASRGVLDYVDVPVLVRFHLSEGFNLFGGPQVSFLTKSKVEGDFGGTTFSFDTDAVKGTDFGLVFGLGYNLPQGFNVQGSYDLGVTPILKDSDTEIFNRGFKLSLGYTF